MKKEDLGNSFITDLRLLNRIGVSILSEYSIEQIINTVYNHVNQLMDAYSFAIGIYNPVSNRINYTGTRENTKVLPDFSVDADNSERFSGWVFQNRKTILMNDYEKEYILYLAKPINPLQGMEPSSCMYVPLEIKDLFLGILSVRTMKKNAYSPRDLEILITLSVFITKAIENSINVKASGLPTTKLPKSYLLDPLSAREIEVLRLLTKGDTNPSIAAALFISASTVKTHTLNIYRKLLVANRTQAIVKAREYGLIL